MSFISGDGGFCVVASMHWQPLLWLHFTGWHRRLRFYHVLRRTESSLRTLCCVGKLCSQHDTLRYILNYLYHLHSHSGSLWIVICNFPNSLAGDLKFLIWAISDELAVNCPFCSHRILYIAVACKLVEFVLKHAWFYHHASDRDRFKTSNRGSYQE